jgi:hypothetical protein
MHSGDLAPDGHRLLLPTGAPSTLDSSSAQGAAYNPSLRLGWKSGDN